METITVRDLIKREIDVDVYDDVCEELGIAFCGPMKLTPVGEEKFAEALDLTVEFVDDCSAIVHVDDPVDKVWKRRLKLAKLFFESAAGYCSESDYDTWFKECE